MQQGWAVKTYQTHDEIVLPTWLLKILTAREYVYRYHCLDQFDRDDQCADLQDLGVQAGQITLNFVHAGNCDLHRQFHCKLKFEDRHPQRIEPQFDLFQSMSSAHGTHQLECLLTAAAAWKSHVPYQLLYKLLEFSFHPGSEPSLPAIQY